MADTFDLDAGLLAYLRGDATLAALLPNGIHFEPAPLGATKFAVISYVLASVDYQFNAVAWEQVLYRVKAVTQGASADLVQQAAERIRVLLQDARFPVTGYEIMRCDLTEPIRYPERDEASNVWYQHGGGIYTIQVRAA